MARIVHGRPRTRPQQAERHRNRGRDLIARGRLDDAVVALQHAIAISPNDPEALDALGVAYNHLGLADEAIASFRSALACDPSFANAACNLGEALIESGEIDEGTRFIERAIELNSADARAYLALMYASRGRVGRRHLETMLAIVQAGDALPHHQRVTLHFALGLALEREGRVDEAFRHLLAGNSLKRADVAYDEAAALEFLRSTEAAFTNPVLAELRDCGDPSERPVFIVGMPRSGSTLVEQILAAHPDVAAGGELNVLPQVVREVWPTMQASSTAELRSEIRGLGERYLRATDELAGNAARLTDKRLDSFQLAPLINLALPKARMIHVQRDRLDTCFSCFATAFVGSEIPFSYDLGELGRYYAAYDRMMERWHALVPPDRLFEVRYERLVADFEGEARRIVAFCGLPWDAACLEFYQARRSVRTASKFQVRQPLYADAVGRAQRFSSHLGPLLEAANRLE